mmetsp:Transcript_28467/g.94503  ORF Transcript_28467/g.94503 Transcript_28467/m.94503 type:complete len:200 (+) Transcript_28467:638-1237(+)
MRPSLKLPQSRRWPHVWTRRHQLARAGTKVSSSSCVPCLACPPLAPVCCDPRSRSAPAPGTTPPWSFGASPSACEAAPRASCLAKARLRSVRSRRGSLYRDCGSMGSHWARTATRRPTARPSSRQASSRPSSAATRRPRPSGPPRTRAPPCRPSRRPPPALPLPGRAISSSDSRAPRRMGHTSSLLRRRRAVATAACPP